MQRLLSVEEAAVPAASQWAGAACPQRRDSKSSIPFGFHKMLAPFMRLKTPGGGVATCQAAGFALLASHKIALESGKQFTVLTFRFQGVAG